MSDAQNRTRTYTLSDMALNQLMDMTVYIIHRRSHEELCFILTTPYYHIYLHKYGGYLAYLCK